MLSVLFTVLLLLVFGKILIFAIKAAWGISKIIVSVVLLPLVLIVMALSGFIYVALVFVVIIGVISLIGGLIFK